MGPYFIKLTDNAGTDPILINVAAIAFISVDRRGEPTVHIGHKDVSMFRVKESLEQIYNLIEEAKKGTLEIFNEQR